MALLFSIDILPNSPMLNPIAETLVLKLVKSVVNPIPTCIALPMASLYSSITPTIAPKFAAKAPNPIRDKLFSTIVLASGVFCIALPDITLFCIRDATVCRTPAFSCSLVFAFKARSRLSEPPLPLPLPPLTPAISESILR